MSTSIEGQIERLKSTIAEMEAQRDALGETVVQKAVNPLLEKLEELNRLLQAPEASPPDKPTQQRKLVTLLFMDIVGSTSIAQHLDAEDVAEVFDVTLKKIAEPVEEHGGHVTRFMGDGFLSVFGAPTAREDDPERAVRAGLKIIELSSKLVGQLQADWDIRDFQVRVGINTGLVILGGETEAEDTLMGAPVNLAARLESAAQPGGLLVSHDTYRHIRGVFYVEPWEPIQAKGFDEPVQAYRVLRSKQRAFRTYTRGVEGVETRMVGREAELKYLQDALLTVTEEGEGQMVTISGEAGVGKSRLLYDFQNWIELLPPPHLRFFEGRGRQEAQGLPYGLLRDIFEFRFQIQEDDSGMVVREKVESGFVETFGEDAEAKMRAHILGQWLGFDFSISPHLKGVLDDPEQLRDRGLMYFVDYFQQLTDQVPVVLFLEDIHWADDSSLDALDHLGLRTHRTGVLVVCTARHTLFERRPYWGEGRMYHHRINLLPLSKRESRKLVAEILKLVEDIPFELSELLVDGAEGNPFYVEELVKMLVENGVILKGDERWHVQAGRLTEIKLPPTLAGVLQARLDSLPHEERTVLQQASIVGRLFWDRIIAHIQTTEGGIPQMVPEALSSLRGKEMIYRHETSTFIDASEYLFKHDILREVTYESVLKRLRRRYHGLVADWLIAHAGARASEYSGLVGEHLQLAERRDEACQYFLKAGESALASYANSEAEAFYKRALDLSPSLSQKAACLAAIGEAQGRAGRREEAHITLCKSIDIYHELGEYDRVAYLYNRSSQILWHQDHQKAWQVCKEGLERLSNASDSPGLAYLLAEAGRTAFFTSQSRKRTVSLLNQAITMAERLMIVEPKAEASITLALIKLGVIEPKAEPNKIPPLIERDVQAANDMLQEIAALCIRHGVLRTAARAYNNLGVSNNLFKGGAYQTYHYYLRAAEIRRQMEDIDEMIFALKNTIYDRIHLEVLSSVEDSLAEFLHKSNATESQVAECLQYSHAYVSQYRGEWLQMLDYFRAQLKDLHQGGSFQEIWKVNYWMAGDILDLYRFAGQDELEQAEAALLENIELQWFASITGFTLVTILARMGRLSDAHKRFDDAVRASAQIMDKSDKSYRLNAEVELALVEERWEYAVVSCQTLIDIYQEGGYRWSWARGLIDLGEALLGRDGPGDQERAQEAYRQSLEMFTEMDAPGYVRVLEERLGECDFNRFQLETKFNLYDLNT